MELITKWINMLRGKPVSSTNQPKQANEVDEGKVDQVPEQSTQKPQQETSSDEDFYFAGDKNSEDSVVKDMKSAESFAKQVIQQVKKAPIPTPKLPKKKQTEGQPSNQLSQNVQTPDNNENDKPSKISNAALGKVIRIIVIIVLILILVFVLFSILRMVQNGGNGRNGGSSQTTGQPQRPTATPVTYKPYVPSIYADDPDILQIEEDVSVLDAELFRTDISDPMIKPPNLDYNISF